MYITDLRRTQAYTYKINYGKVTMVQRVEINIMFHNSFMFYIFKLQNNTAYSAQILFSKSLSKNVFHFFKHLLHRAFENLKYLFSPIVYTDNNIEVCISLGFLTNCALLIIKLIKFYTKHFYSVSERWKIYGTPQLTWFPAFCSFHVVCLPILDN